MTCAWFLDHVHAYAVGALDAGDRVRVEQHLKETSAHEGCREALREALEVVDLLDAALPAAQPSDAVWKKIAASTGKAPATRRASRTRPARWREEIAWGIGIAACIAAVSFYGTARTLRRAVDSANQQVARLSGSETDREQCRSDLARTQKSSAESRDLLALLDKPETRVVAFRAQGASPQRAAAIVDTKSGHAYVVSAAMPKLPGKTYQLWVIRGKEAPRPAGFVRAEAGGAAIGEFDPALTAQRLPNALAVSIEPEGGSATPTEVILVAPLQG